MKCKIESTKSVYNGFLKIDEVNATFDAFDGSQLNKTFEVLDIGDAVAVLVEDIESQSFLLVKQLRIPTLKHQLGWILEIPAGMMESFETPENCAKRELMEEIGYHVNELNYLFPFYATPGASTERVHLFHAKVTSKDKIQKGGGAKNEIEDINIVSVKIKDIKKMIGNEIIDGKSIIGIYHYFSEK